MQHSFEFVAPANTVSAQLTAGMIDGVNNVDPSQSAFLDDFSLTGVVAPAPVGPIAYEGFDYSPGTDLLGQNGGSGFAGPWSVGGLNATIHDNYEVASGSLDSTDRRSKATVWRQPRSLAQSPA